MSGRKGNKRKPALDVRYTGVTPDTHGVTLHVMLPPDKQGFYIFRCRP